MICRICLNETESALDIFDSTDEQYNKANILEKHLLFKILPDDAISTIVCQICWRKVDEFHLFYTLVERAQSKLLLTRTQETGILDLEVEIKQELLDNTCNEEETSWLDNENPLEDQEMTEIELNDDPVVESNKRKQSSVTLENEQLSSKETSDKRIRRKCRKQSKVNAIKRTRHFQKYTDHDEELVQKYIRMICELCTFICEDFKDIKKHFKTHHDGQRPYVLCCERKLTDRSLLVQHAYKHEDPEHFKCKECKKVFGDSYILRGHMLTTHASREAMKFKCKQCDRRFSRRFHLESHEASHIPIDERKFLCDKCPQNKAFASKQLLHMHVQSQHIRATNVCHVCAKEIRSNQSFEKHVRSHFGEIGPRVKCPRPNCDSWLKDEENLKYHLQLHEDEGKIFTCSHCGKGCKNRKSLSGHIYNVHSGDVFPCEVCHKTFKKALALKEHMAQHTGESLYSCPYCTRTFNSKANMHSHKKKMHPVEWAQNKNRLLQKLHN